MSDLSAQPNTPLVNRFVGNPHSAVGSLMRKSLMGRGVQPTQPLPAAAQPTVPKLVIPEPSAPEPSILTSSAPEPAIVSPVVFPDPIASDSVSSETVVPDLVIPQEQVSSSDSVVTVQEPAVSPEDSAGESLALLENILSQVENKRAQDSPTIDVATFPAEPAIEESVSPEPQTADISPAQSISEPVLPVVQTPPEPSSMDATGLLSQVASQVVQDSFSEQVQQINPLNPTGVVSQGGKEAAGSVTLEQVAIDAARGAQQVELEPAPEIPPEVESYLQKVEDNTNLAPPEIVIADGSQTSPVNHAYPAQPVIVLPITSEEEAQGARKSPRFSVRWLVEWSRKIMKVFSGKVIYRMPEEKAS